MPHSIQMRSAAVPRSSMGSAVSMMSIARCILAAILFASAGAFAASTVELYKDPG